jgi:uncharacterized pyridoxamine 5'-phosphate oxidase family protein
MLLGVFNNLPNDVLDLIHFQVHKGNMKNVHDIIKKYGPIRDQYTYMYAKSRVNFCGYKQLYNNRGTYANIAICSKYRNYSLLHLGEPCFFLKKTKIESAFVHNLMNKRIHF